ncbi:putative spindle and kinetochore-associated protein [Rosa chinensis]|uniref:Putative spindle and kinetochore-associated protein n=1 Tax=Rosa chinensis TaxID=74649 RepID=A0A2P6SFQ3_ROSCH|nr:putative spindle and kinetochore-associated protein [Rosa chinensis]
MLLIFPPKQLSQLENENRRSKLSEERERERERDGGGESRGIAGLADRRVQQSDLGAPRARYCAKHTVSDLSAVDAAVKAMELQVQAIKDRVRDETLAIPKAKVKLIDESLKQRRKLKDMSIYAPNHVPERMSMLNLDTNRCLFPESSQQNTGSGTFKLEEDPAPPPPPKEKKDRSMPPLWFVSAEELDSLSSSDFGYQLSCGWQGIDGKKPWK